MKASATPPQHLADRTTEVDVDEIRAFPIDDLARCLPHARAIRTEQLDTHRPLAVVELADAEAAMKGGLGGRALDEDQKMYEIEMLLTRLGARSA